MKEKAGEPGSETRTSLGRPGGRVQTVTAAGGPQGRREGHSKMLVAPPLSSDSAADISLELTLQGPWTVDPEVWVGAPGPLSLAHPAPARRERDLPTFSFYSRWG